MTELALDAVTVLIGKRKLLSDVTFRVRSGEFVAVVGPNGAGKTSLLRTALGLLAPTSGSVTIDGRPASTLHGRERAARVAWLPQQLAPSEPLTALEIVMAARYRFDEPRAQARKAAGAALERLKASALAGTRIDRVSGGERQRVALAALLAQEAELLLVDEPANHLDPGHQAETYRLLGELWAQGLGVVCVTHDVNLLAHAGRPAELRLLGLHGGSPRFETPYADAELDQKLGALFGIAMGTFQAGPRRFVVPLIDAGGDAS
jgi:iron complex transport system ATP-binding protein